MVLARYSLVRPHPEHDKSVGGSRLALIAAAVSALCAAAVFSMMVVHGDAFGARAVETLPKSAASLPATPAPPVATNAVATSTTPAQKEIQSGRRLVFSLTPSRHFQHLGTVGVQVRRIDARHGNYDVTLLVNRRRTTKRRVRLNEPIALKSTKAGVVSELVVNEIERDRVSGYIKEQSN
ncbi:MAG TPA: hypothetical protein VFB14_25860 [Bryobacteraceae bacterium]|nr:hypothetical protein [Bryobacteraceae bacterium]